MRIRQLSWPVRRVAGAPALNVIVALAADALNAGGPALGTPLIAQAHVVAAPVLAAGTPTLVTPAIGQRYAPTHLNEKLDDTYMKVEEMHAILLQAKGARWVIVGLAGIAGLASGWWQS